MISDEQRERDASSPLKGDHGTVISTRLLSAVIVVVLSLIVVVVGVGLARDNLDATGVAVSLSTLLSGIVVGTLLKGKGGGGGAS